MPITDISTSEQKMTTTRLGYIGPGIMGKPMIDNLQKAGYPVTVYARRESQRKSLADAGWSVVNTPADVARQSDIIFICVSDTPDVENVIFGENGLSEGLAAGKLVIDMSTISALETREFAKRLADIGVNFLDAPVSGGEHGAISGTLSIMVGGTDESFARAKPYFEILGQNIVHVGASGAGQTAKACNQVLVAQTINAVAEALALAGKAGVDPAKVREALLGGFANSKILEVHGQRMLDDNYTPGFKAKLHQKDMHIVADMANTLGIELPGANLTTEQMDVLVAQGMGELDSAALRKLIAD